MKYKVAIISLKQSAVSETFIQAHVEAFAAQDFYLYGSGGHYKINDRPVAAAFPVQKILGRLPWLEGIRNPYRLLGKFLRQNNIQCVIAEYGQVGADVMGVCKDLQVPLIVNFFGFDISTHSVLKAYEAQYREMFGHAAWVTGVSRKMLDDLGRVGCPVHKLVYNPCGPNKRCFDLVPAKASDHYLAISRFVEKKGPQLTLLAFYEVIQQEPAARLIMVGDGPLLGACKWLVKSLAMEHAVEFRGFLDHPASMDCYAESFCFVQHSVTATNGDSEGTPVAILEAGAAGLPVISTRHAGIPDVVVEEETGILVNEGDVEAMAAAMLRLYRNRHLCAQMGAAARARVQEHFSMEKHIGILNSLIEKAVEQAR